MPKRVLAAQLSHETNVFGSTRTDLAAFERSGIAFGDDIFNREGGTNSAFGGFFTGAETSQFDLAPLMSVWATPSGVVTAAAFEWLAGRLCALIRNAAADGPVDGVLLALHGAMVTERHPDADGEILRRVRRVVGRETPIVATLDLHANISDAMVELADVLIGYDTYPHVDMAARSDEAAALLSLLMNRELQPTAFLCKPPMMPTSQRMMTDREPMSRLIAKAHEFESLPNVLNVTIAGGFPPADVEEAGFSLLVTTDNEPRLAEQLAKELTSLAWEERDQFLGGVSSFDEAAVLIRSRPERRVSPLLLVDIGDNPWSGGTGDSVELVRFLLREGVSDSAVAIVVDPESVCRCASVGIGMSASLELGAKTDRLHGDPLPCVAEVTLLSDGCYVNEGPMMTGLGVDLGQTAVIRVGRLPIEVIVTSRAETPIDLNVFRRHGIEPTRRRVIGLKGKGHFRASFAPIAGEIVLVEGPGITGADLSRLPFANIRRPIWPLDPDLVWSVDARH